MVDPAWRAPSVSHSHYLSTDRTTHEYYCDDDYACKNLSPKYLVHLATLADVMREYPGRTLHAPGWTTSAASTFTLLTE